MAARALLYLGQTSNKCIFTSLQYQKPRLQVQTSWRQTRGFKRPKDTSKETNSAFSEIAVETATMSSGKLWKPLGFTITFSGASIVTASIWEYENMRGRMFNSFNSFTRLRSGWRGEAQRWWRSLSDGERVFAPICFLNVVVYLGWRIPALKSTMLRYFCTNPSSNVMCWPMLLSTFSHYSLFHLAANMYVLHSFSTAAVSSLGKEQFVAFYLSSGVVSSMVSNVYKTAFARPGLSVGASGAIMGVLGFICTQYPESMLNIAFLPMWKFTAGSVIKGLVAMDLAGCIAGWKFMDHAAHLGGAFFGIFWQTWGNKNIWQEREPIIKYWHDFRKPPRSN
ncbi:presenilins-associated rhomboid-like protein, mitochondrial isoform X2 [Venturia canescens]|nr:presenilins-associated rhomboid-like protein, mitochondrial isoform X2 [Venturia canescens]XP_043275475.1 presenilins-associated rhomboid-like protein, mitochondrial isoform X2 [Venturia canescens]